MYSGGRLPKPRLNEHYGYTEPLRRQVQRENFSPQANAIPNTMPSWLPGDDYLTNFHLGDPFIKVDEGYARLPGPGYEALHPELNGLKPEDYPDIHKLAILADVAPYSREYNIFRQKVNNDSTDNTELRIEYEKILDRVRQTRESVIKMENQGSPSPRTQKHLARPRKKRPPRLRQPGFEPWQRCPRLSPLSWLGICFNLLSSASEPASPSFWRVRLGTSHSIFGAVRRAEFSARSPLDNVSLSRLG
jgi:hypothetical protein